MAIQITSEGERVAFSICTSTTSPDIGRIDYLLNVSQTSTNADIISRNSIMIGDVPLMDLELSYSPVTKSGLGKLHFGSLFEGADNAVFQIEPTQNLDGAVVTGAIQGRRISPFAVVTQGSCCRDIEVGPIEFRDGTRPQLLVKPTAQVALKAMNVALQAEYEVFRGAQAAVLLALPKWLCKTLCYVAYAGCLASTPAGGPLLLIAIAGCVAGVILCLSVC